VIFLGRPKDSKANSETPGPGAYLQTSKSFVSSNKGIILLGRHKESNIERFEPGPGSYDIKPTYFDSNDKKIGFGHGERFQNYIGPSNEKNGKMGGKIDNSIPGPGAYNIKISPRGPKFTIKSAKIDPLFKSKSESPAPGAYTLNDELDMRLRGGRFSSSKRPEFKPVDGPGPGFYDCKAAL